VRIRSVLERNWLVARINCPATVEEKKLVVQEGKGMSLRQSWTVSSDK
jgi:hypothetical protein